MDLLSFILSNKTADAVKGVAHVLAAVLAVGTFIAWRANKMKADALARQLEAREVLARFTREVMQHPDIAIPSETGVQATRYQQFMQLLLTTVDEILVIDPTPEWRQALSSHLAPHAAYLATPAVRDGLLPTLSTETRALVDATVRA